MLHLLHLRTYTKRKENTLSKTHQPPADLVQKWEVGDYAGALALAASWPELGDHKDAIKKGHAAHTNRRFYTELGEDPNELYSLGVHAVAERYGLTAPPAESLQPACGCKKSCSKKCKKA